MEFPPGHGRKSFLAEVIRAAAEGGVNVLETRQNKNIRQPVKLQQQAAGRGDGRPRLEVTQKLRHAAFVRCRGPEAHYGFLQLWQQRRGDVMRGQLCFQDLHP